MKSMIVTWILLTLMILTPMFVLAQGLQTDTTTPPISQPLVREGTFAVTLANNLKLTKTTNENEAETALAAVGIAPINGWISDYPVTPDILGDIQKSITKATKSGNVIANEDTAQKALQTAASSYSMSVTPAPASSTAAQDNQGSGYYDDTVINNYYANEGPPVVTYYAPPTDYSYLYTWVPYPFWWWGWWFDGYYILSNFTFPIGYYGYWPGVWYPYHRWYGSAYCYHNWYGNIYWGNHGPWYNANAHAQHAVVSNHYRDAVTHAMGTINPATHALTAGTGGRSQWATPSGQASARAIVAAHGGSSTAAKSRVQGRIATPANRTYSPRTAPSYNYPRVNHSYSPGSIYTQRYYASRYNNSGSEMHSYLGNSSRSFATGHSYGGYPTGHSYGGYSGGARGFSGGRR